MLNIYQKKTGQMGFRKTRSMIFLLFILTAVFSFRVNAANFSVSNLNDAGPGSLRQAILDANSAVGADVINFNITGTINLTSGQILVSDALTITGPGMNLLIINQTTDNRVFITATGAITFVLQDLTLNFTGPGVVPYSGGGGAILTGGAGASTTLINVTISNFRNQIGNGGAISASSSLNNHSLTITDCIFINNKCGGAGGAVSYNSQGGTATITGSTFSGNHTGPVGVNTGGDGGAIATTGGGAGGTYVIEKNTFLNNQVENVTGHAGAIMNTNGTATIQFNRFIGNTCLNNANPPLANVIGQAGGATTHITNAENNWWGVNTGPGANDATALNAGAVMNLTKWLQLKTSASPNSICFIVGGIGNTATVTTSFLSNSANDAIAASNLVALVGASVTWGPTTLGSLSGQQGTIQASGTATALFTSNGTGGTATVNARVDNVPASESAPSRASIIVNATPAPTVTNPVTYCQNATASPLTATGSNLLWYSTATGGTGSETAPTPLTTSTGTTSYFVSQTVSGCEGPRAQIDVVVNEIPAITAPTITQPSCATPTGTIVINATGTGTLEYSVDNGATHQESATFSGLAPGDYNITVRSQSSPSCVTAYANNPVTLNAVPGCLDLSINDVLLNEGNSGTTTFTFTVSLSAPAPAGGVSFDIATQDGTTNPATQPSDYTAKSLTSQTIPAGSSTYSFTVAVNGDLGVESDEIFFVNVSNVTGATVGDGQGLGTITNDDVAPVLTSVTVTTSPVGRTIIVDGNTLTAPQTFNWTPGSNHTIATTTPQSGAAGTRYTFNNWSNGGAISHVVTTPSVATTYTANFTTQHQVTTSAGAGGSILPVSGSFYDAGTVVPVTATADAGFNFTEFTGDLTGVTNPQSLTMDGPKSVTAQFAVVPPPAASLTLSATGPSGTICGENLSVTIKVKDFIDIGTLDFSVNWDASKLELLSYTPLTIDDDAPLTGEFFPAGQLTYTWFDSDIDYGVTLADGTTILTLNFKALVNSATGVMVNITGTPTAINASDLNFEEVTVTTENLVSFNIDRVFVTSPTITQPTCALSTGTIVVNATGNGTLEYSVDGGTSWFPTNTFADLAPGNYTVAARLQSNPTCIISYSSNPVVLTAATGCCVPPTINAPTVTQPTCATATGTIVVNATGSGTLEYSINGGTSWFPTATFGGLAPGNYNIAVRLQSSPACLANYSSSPVVLTAATGCVVVCPKSQGYWKNNPSVWPASALPMMLGSSNTYTKQQLRKILNTAVGAGAKADASLILARQLIAAKLNIAAGATTPASVTSAITAADAAIGTSLIPMNVRPNTTLGKKMTSYAKTLESFNTGQLNAGCGTLLTTSGMSSGLSMNVVPENFELEQNYPNPFSSVTTIRYVVPVESTVSLAVYNNQGQLMAKLADGRVKAGNHQVRFDASKLAAGIYLYRLQTVDANGQIVVINKKMILSK